MIFKRFTPSFIVLFFLFLIIQLSSFAQPGITWTSRTSAADNSWRSVTYGAGLFVAVASTTGVGNRVMTSPDGITWTSRTSAADNNWYSVTYAAGLFVAVASTGTGNRVMTSPNGINWTIRNSAADNNWRGVTYGNGLFVAVAMTGTGNGVMTSPDGITWTSRTTPADNQWNDVTFGNGLFVAVARTGIGNRVMTSADGVNWTIRVSASDHLWNDLTYGNGLFVAVAGSAGANAAVMTSPDGINWTNRTPAADNQWNSITYGADLFIAVSTTGIGEQVMTSPDGIIWTSRNLTAPNNWNSITYSNGIFVAVAVTGTGDRVMTSGTYSTLPLRWLNVTGTITTANQARINWRVTEQNVSRYEVEKSNNGNLYSSISNISSQGDGENSYSFTDNQILAGAAYYRIKQTDIDGKFSYSNIISLHLNNLQQISIYPNPVKDQLTVTVAGYLLNKNAVLTDREGKLLQTVKISSQSFTVNLAGYPGGLYLLKIDHEQSIKIMKE